MNKVLKIISFISLCCALILVTGCINAQTEANNAIKNLQKSVPYPIIVPTYFPKGIRPIPSTVSDPENDPMNNALDVEIIYGNTNNKQIVLIEENYYSTLVLTNPGGTFTKNGIDVTYEEVSTSSATEIIHGFLFGWNNDGVNFQLRIYGYDQAEGQKVVESMIK